MSRIECDLIEADIEKVLKAAGSDDLRRQDAADFLPRFCEYKNGVTVIKEIGVAIDQPAALAWIEKNRPQFLPPKFETSLADEAFLGAGNKTVAQRLVTQIGLAEATKVAQSYVKRTVWDTRPGTEPTDRKDETANAKADPRKNPWADNSPQGEARRVEVIRSLGTKVAAGLAKAAGKDLAGRELRRA